MLRVLITGGAGFLGHHLVHEMLLNNVQVTVVDNLSTGKRENFSPHAENLVMDLGKLNVDMLKKFDVVIHAAARADIRNNWEPGERDQIWHSNVHQTFHLVRKSVDAGVGAFAFISSASVYGHGGPHAELDALLPASPYAASKAAAESLLLGFSGGTVPIIFRPVSMVGTGYRHGHVLDFVRQLMVNGEIMALDSGKQQKEYCPVDSAAAMIWRCMTDGSKYEGPRIFNIGGERWSIRETAKLLDCNVTWPDNLSGWVGDPIDICVNSDRALGCMPHGWKQRDLKSSFQETIDWLKSKKPWIE